MQQTIIYDSFPYPRTAQVLKTFHSKKVLLVCQYVFDFIRDDDFLKDAPCEYVIFDSFSSNPLYEDVCAGVKLFRKSGCDTIVAVGGGSSIDVAKSIKLFCKMDESIHFLKQEPSDTGVPLIAVPTTAGTGSESTRFSVIYYEGVKQSINHLSIIPDCAVLDASLLLSLPQYQKKCTMLDALCQGMESFWCVNANEESREYSRIAIETILENYREYIFENTLSSAKKIMLASNNSGRAINLTQTTAPHAMSYKMSSLYHLPHGHAVAIALPEVWDYMIAHPHPVDESSSQENLLDTFNSIAKIMGASSATEGVALFREILKELDITTPASDNREEELSLLTQSVNPTRLKNNPVFLSETTLHSLYERIIQ